MNKRAIAAGALIAALSLSSLAFGASAQEPADDADSSATSKSATGFVAEGTRPEGSPTYYLEPIGGGEPIELQYGPSWLWGPASPLQLLVGLGEVTVVGQVRDGEPNENASPMAQAQADRMPVMRVRSVIDFELRGKGRPPWAGGPKSVGEAHPGFEAWDESQAAKAAEKAADAAERAAEKAEEKAERAAEKAEEKAERAAEKAAKAEKRAEERGN